MSDCHGYSLKGIFFPSWALLCCNIVSITYKEKLNAVLHGCHANKSLFPPDRLCRLWGGVWGGGGIWADSKQEIRLFGEAELCFSCQLHSPQSALTQTVTSQGCVFTKTFKRLQQMDNIVWLKRHCVLQMNEFTVCKSVTDILAAGWLIMSQKEPNHRDRTDLTKEIRWH